MSSATDFLLLSKSPELRAKQVAYGRAVDQARQQAENRAALREAMRPAEKLPSSRVPSAAEYALNSRITAANREERPTGALGIIRRELPRFFRADDELADAMGDFSLRQGATATAGALGGLAAPAYLPLKSVLARMASGATLTNAGDRMLDPAAKKILGTEISDPAASTVFGALAGKTGKIGVPLLASLATSAGDAEAGPLTALRRRIFNGKMDTFDLGDTTRKIRNRVVIEEDPDLREREFNKKALIEQLTKDAEKHSDLYTQAFLDEAGNALGLYQTRRHPGKGTSLNYMISDQPGLGTEMLEEVYRFAPEKPVTLHALPGTEDFYRRFPEWEEDRSEGVSKFIRKAGGGVVRKALEKFGRRAAHSGDIDVSVEAPRGALSVVKQKGGNWLSGSVEDALKGLKKDTPEWLRPGVNPGMPTRDMSKEDAINSWIDKQLTRYVKNEMATPEDPIRALAERGVLHFDPEVLGNSNDVLLGNAAASRARTAFPIEGMAQGQLARRWEAMSDAATGHQPASRRLQFELQKEQNPWLEKLAPETPVYHFNNPTGGLGFSHLIDELSNAMRAHAQEQELASWLKNAKTPEEVAVARRGNPVDLPRHLQLDPKSMERVSVPQAVQRVSEINAWRAAKQAEANLLRANNAATVLHKEYPDKGFKWVELKKPSVMNNPETSDANFKDSLSQAQQQLADALKYEGDTMGHCVGGYCDDVASGRSRIYSLRDAKGQPHVTIETRPVERDLGAEQYKWATENPEEYAAFKQRFPSLSDQDQEFRKMFVESQTSPTQRIIQIKGKQNRAPNEEYLPFVQDFVRSGKWSDVGDLQNTGLYRRSTLTPEEQALIQNEYLTMDEIKKLREGKPWVPIDDTPEFAQGGSVRTPAWPTCKCDYKEQAA